MSTGLFLRPATLRDADLLLKWRNDTQTRMASHNTLGVNKKEHLKWLESSLENNNRELLIAEEDNIPIGTVRSDYSTNGVYEISWTVAPHARNMGLGKKMVALFVSKFSSPIRAEIKSENYASIKIAKYIGMKLEKVENNILHYRRDTGHLTS